MNEITLQGIRTMLTRRIQLNLAKNIRRREYVYGRALYFKLAKEFTSSSYKEIGSLVDRDHASVIHGLKVFEMLVLHKDPILNTYYECRRILTSVKEDLVEDNDTQYWRAKYESMRDLYVNAVERLAKYEKKEVTTAD